ncbi:MAG: hypothetical protein OHK0057_21590 [Thermoflexibacter sp.]
MKIVADENVNFRFIKLLRSQGFEVQSVTENNSGISDREVAQIAQEGNCILLTEDKDFGELVFAHQLKDLNIIFLRYDKEDEEKIATNILTVLQTIDFSDKYLFVTITKNKIRMTNL